MTDTTMYIIWGVAIIGFGVLEGVTAQLVSIWFVFGSIGGLIAAGCGADLLIQVIAFIAVSAISLIATRPIVKKRLNTKIEKTNADRCIGQDAIVLEDISNLDSQGTVKADGKIWSARSLDGSAIQKDEIVKIEKIEGVKLIVSHK